MSERERALRDAAALYCEHCANDVPLVPPDSGSVQQWSHSGPGVWAWCKVQEIAALRAPDERRDSADQLRLDRAKGHITDDDFYRRWEAMEARERAARAPADRATANRQEG